MSIKVKQKDWQKEDFRNAILSVAELLQEDIEIECKKVKFKSYNVQIWLNDNVELEKDFYNKKDALKFVNHALRMKKYSLAYADLKKYNKKNDDFDWWFFRNINDEIKEVTSPELVESETL